MSPDPITAERSELRKKGLALREEIPTEMRDAYSQIIRKRTIEYLDSIAARFVHTYISFRSEVATYGIIEDLFDRGIKIAVPAIRSDGNTEQMGHSLIEDLDHLHAGKFGIPEPDVLKEAPISKLDAVITPIAAFDGFGMRLGYGKGYYDRFLSVLPQRVKRIGLAFSIQEMDIIPMMSHDELMNNIITEQSNYFFK